MRNLLIAGILFYALPVHAESGGLALGFNVSYLPYKSSEIDSFFKNSSFQEVGKNYVSWGGIGYFITPNGFYLGGAWSEIERYRHLGNYEANFSLGYGGFFAAYEIFQRSYMHAYMGTLLGGGGAKIEILSAGPDGRYQEDYFVAEPTLGFLFSLSKFIRIGLIAKYFIPVVGSHITKGDDLGLKNISQEFWSIGFNVMFGRFDAFEAPSFTSDKITNLQ